MSVLQEEKNISKKDTRINREIIAVKVRLIGAEGEQLGILDIKEAMIEAQARSLDLVEISPHAEPPVCRLMDYGKYKFSQSKKKTAQKKKQKQTQVKEVKFRPVTDVGDYNVKLRNITRFLENGDKVKVTIRFRGRELAHREQGAEMLSRIENDLKELAVIEQRGKFEGRQLIMVMAPKA